LSQTFAQEIFQGALGLMSLKKINEITGFSYSTISRIISGKAKEFRISDETCQAILDAAESLNYRPNLLAQSLRLKKTYTIGLMVSDIQNPFFGDLASKIEKHLRKHGYSTILCNTGEDQKNEEFYLNILVDRQVDGIILVPIQAEEWDYLESLSVNIPVVLMDRIFSHTELAWVTSDNTKAAQTVTENLIGLGYRQIAFLGGSPETYINTVRFQGFKKALEKHSITPDESIILFKGYGTGDGEEMMKEVLQKKTEIEAVFCVNNLVFLGAMKAIQEFEMSGGPSIMIAAFDIGRYCHVFKRPLICANQDLDAIGKTAVQLLMNQITESPGQKNHVIVPINVCKHRLDG
jgi:LacI family transcriptional regulator